ncbi:MAG: hypothetical protein KOO60_07365 [Gemmatimonadales bacterium]|nr:hypothetical protein [Gemmatimonadales bacterium]
MKTRRLRCQCNASTCEINYKITDADEWDRLNLEGPKFCLMDGSIDCEWEVCEAEEEPVKEAEDAEAKVAEPEIA